MIPNNNTVLQYFSNLLLLRKIYIIAPIIIIIIMLWLHRLLSEGSSGEDSSSSLFNVAIATIFAREFLEGAIIIGNYRTVIHRNDQWNDDTKARALTTVTRSAAGASLFAIVVVLAIAIPLGVLSKDLDERTVEIIEGISKIVAAVCILQLSVKIPVWLGIYWKVSILPWKNTEKNTDQEGNLEDLETEIEQLSFNELRFNVAWNIWREVAECGVFLIPFFLGTGAEAIPLSALVGIAVSLVLGFGLYVANHKLKSKTVLAWFMSGLTLFLAVGLFVGGCHEFEEVWGETNVVWKIDNENMSHKKFPMVILKPFGYSSKRTVLQITTFWCFLGVGLFYHFLKWNATRMAKIAFAERQTRRANAASEENNGVDSSCDVDKPGAVTTTGGVDVETGTEPEADKTKASTGSEDSDADTNSNGAPNAEFDC